MFKRVMQGAVHVIQGNDPLGADQVREVAGLLEQCLRDGQPHVVLDLENTPLIDSAGLELLLDFKEQYEQSGGALKLESPNPLCEEILSVTGVDESIETFPEALSAAGSFAR